jgi:hypothetical protein
MEVGAQEESLGGENSSWRVSDQHPAQRHSGQEDRAVPECRSANHLYTVRFRLPYQESATRIGVHSVHRIFGNY